MKFKSGNTAQHYKLLFFGDSGLANVQIENPMQLITEFDKAMQQADNKSVSQAILYSEKLAQYSGVPGLLCYASARIKLIKNFCSEEEEINQLAFNTLSYLILAKLLYESDAEASKALEKLMPEEAKRISGPNSSSNYWDDKRKEIEKAAKVNFNDEAIEDANAAANQFFSALCNN